MDNTTTKGKISLTPESAYPEINQAKLKGNLKDFLEGHSFSGTVKERDFLAKMLSCNLDSLEVTGGRNQHFPYLEKESQELYEQISVLCDKINAIEDKAIKEGKKDIISVSYENKDGKTFTFELPRKLDCGIYIKDFYRSQPGKKELEVLSITVKDERTEEQKEKATPTSKAIQESKDYEDNKAIAKTEMQKA